MGLHRNVVEMVLTDDTRLPNPKHSVGVGAIRVLDPSPLQWVVCIFVMTVLALQLSKIVAVAAIVAYVVFVAAAAIAVIVVVGVHVVVGANVVAANVALAVASA